MAHDLSNLFSGNPRRPKTTFEFVSKRPGPFNGKPMGIRTNDAEGIYNFMERNKTANAEKQETKATI